jgi:glycosyltransferase involved in cell wall biosynthesis
MEHNVSLRPSIGTEPALQVDTWLPERRSLRVAVVTETYPPEVNGVAATISRVVDGLHAAGHELQLLRPRQDKTEEAAQDERFAEVLMRGLPIPRYPQLRLGLPAKRALLQQWTTQRPDVVHIVTEGPLGYSALQAAAQLKLPMVSDFRTNFHAYSKHYGIAWLRTPIMAYLRKFHNRTACTMVPTDALRGELMLAGFKNLRVVSRGVDTRLFDPSRRNAALRASWGADVNDPVVLSVGRLAPEKNLPLLVEAFNALRAQEPRAKLVVVGDGPLRAALQQSCPQAIFSGMQRGENLATHYASADLFLFPSVTETFGNVLPEAMASGLAVVAYDYAAARQLVRHGDNGLLVPFDDKAAFCAAAARLAGQLGWVRALGAQGRITARMQDWASIVERVEQAYVGAMAQPRRAVRAAWSPVLPR